MADAPHLGCLSMCCPVGPLPCPDGAFALLPSSTIPELEARIAAVQADISNLTPTTVIDATATAVVDQGQALKDTLPGLRAALVALSGSITGIVDLNTIKTLLIRVKVCVFMRHVVVWVMGDG
jgi:hypothetical protein